MSLESERNNLTPEMFFAIYKPATDHDGVMCDTRGNLLEFVNKQLGTNFDSRDMRTYHCVRDWAIKVGKTFNYAQQLEDYVWYDPNFLRQAKPLPGAVETAAWFYGRGIKFPIITSRVPDLWQSTIDWYQEHMPFVDKDLIYMQRTKEMDGGVFKAYMIRLLNIGCMLEDFPAQAKKMLDYTDVNIILLSDSSDLDQPIYRPRVWRIKGENGVIPDLTVFKKEFLDESKPNNSVAQY